MRFQLSKSLPASLQGDEPTEPTEVDEDRGPRDERESYRREKRFWKRGSKATSIMSTGNVVASTKNSPTSMTDRKSRVTIENNVACGNVVDWQNIPKVEIVQHVDDDDDNEESENESPPSPGKEEEKKNETGTNGSSSRGPRWWWRSGQCIHLTTDQSWVRISVPASFFFLTRNPRSKLLNSFLCHTILSVVFELSVCNLDTWCLSER